MAEPPAGVPCLVLQKAARAGRDVTCPEPAEAELQVPERDAAAAVSEIEVAEVEMGVTAEVGVAGDVAAAVRAAKTRAAETLQVVEADKLEILFRAKLPNEPLDKLLVAQAALRGLHSLVPSNWAERPKQEYAKRCRATQCQFRSLKFEPTSLGTCCQRITTRCITHLEYELVHSQRQAFVCHVLRKNESPAASL